MQDQGDDDDDDKDEDDDHDDDDNDDDGKCGLITLWPFNNLIFHVHLFSRHAWYEDGRLLLILVTLCVVLPLSMLPKIG